MTGAYIVGVLHNTALLLAVALLYDLALERAFVGGSKVRQAVLGGLLGSVTIATMVAAVEVAPGVFFDTRSVVLSVGGLFFGVLPAVVAGAVASVYRLWVGGPGAMTGTLVVVASVVVGLVWRHVRSGRVSSVGALELAAFGVLVGVVELLLLTTLPNDVVRTIFPAIALPNVVAHTLATLGIGLLLVRRDRREASAQKLSDAESRYRTLFEHTPSVMFLVDPDTHDIVDANDAAAAFYGYSREQLCSMRISDINTLPPERVASKVGQARSGARARFRFRHRLADGSIRDVEVYSGPVRIDGRDLLHSVVHDVTERTLVESAMKSQAQSLRLHTAALEAAANPIVITDRDGVIEWVNAAFTELTGYARGEAIGRKPGSLIGSGAHPPEFFQHMWNTILAGHVWRGRLTNRRKDGTLYEEEQTITPVRGTDGEIMHFIAVKSDLSERLELQERLHRSQKMETVGRLAGGVAHDFNNLLTVIIGTAELVLHDRVADDPELREEIEQIRATADRASELTRQLLAFSRRQLVQVQVVDLNVLLAGLVRLLARLLGEDVLLETRWCEGPALIRADPGQIEQVVVNLAVNARDAMPGGGRLSIETSRGSGGPDPSQPDAAASELARPSSWVCLRVTDSGEGIAPEIMDRMFEPFFTTKPEGKGTGLGLATVYGIVGQNGGAIEVRSVPGEGATFTLFFPRVSDVGDVEAAAGSSTDVAIPAARAREGAQRVLVIEDEPAIRRVVERVLTRDGFDVVVAESAEGALALLAGDAVADLLFTDVVLPGMSGPDLVRRALELRPGLPVLFASGYAAHSLPVDQPYPFLAKPYSSSELVSAVREALRSAAPPR